MKNIITIITLFISTLSFANINNNANDLEHLVKEQSIISELIFETFLFKDSADWKEIVTKNKLQFELNQKALLEISKKDYVVLNALLQENVTLWEEFEKHLEFDEQEEVEAALFELSKKILLSNEKIVAVATKGIYTK